MNIEEGDYIETSGQEHREKLAELTRQAEETRREGLSAIFLNVNRDNEAVIRIYEHLGFRKVREEKNAIGGGFYMDDFVLECPV